MYHQIGAMLIFVGLSLAFGWFLVWAVFQLGYWMGKNQVPGWPFALWFIAILVIIGLILQLKS